MAGSWRPDSPACNGQKVVRANFGAWPDRLLYWPIGDTYTVAHAVHDYLRYILLYRRSGASVIYQANRYIPPDLGVIAVSELSPDRLRDWFEILSRVPAARGTGHPLLNPSADDMRRRKVAANRILSVLTSALNLAFRDGKANDDRAWRRVRQHKVPSIRLRYLTEDEARDFLRESPADFRDLVLAALCTGCRQGELIRMKVDASIAHIAASTWRQARTAETGGLLCHQKGQTCLRASCGVAHPRNLCS